MKKLLIRHIESVFCWKVVAEIPFFGMYEVENGPRFTINFYIPATKFLLFSYFSG